MAKSGNDSAVHGYRDALKRYQELVDSPGCCPRCWKDPPDAFIGVDAPDFNLWLRERKKKAGVPAIIL